MLIIGEIEYANVYPIFYNLKKKNFEEFRFIKSYPSILNKALREGGIDISCCSSIEYVRNCGNYYILPDISISSLKEVKSVCLFSNYDIKYLKNKKIYLTEESGTSIVLLKIIFKKFYNVEINFSPNKDECEAFLYIGDKALYKYYNNEFKYIFDLGKIWYEATGLPFVYALWLVSKETYSKKRELIKKLYNELIKIKNDSKLNLSSLVEHYFFKGLTPYQIIDYWEIINYNLSKKHIEGLNLFYKYAYEIGEVKNICELDILNF
ncbi:conserved hypothetical protein [Deferribacter desulfuricans SSM1]|uniref:Chorismate dehydratase n=1 Tax=Deferribacter desulfuricans (strain DSM 14783 / JCM 11476 / NBRC 101012 / SSM1) TaxID=639282 RepID=D3PDS3_DEFDS|nr:menaquinone biosynthesis protein [Deferribacter desulfuricans]BAI80746.1 conserved hypothetical protein [Deferribacter desulfuricans SSM1]